MKSILPICLAVLCFTACKNDQKPAKVAGENTDTAKAAVGEAVAKPTESAPKMVYTSLVENLRIREKPTADGTVLTTVKKGDVLDLTGKKTTEKVTMELQGKPVSDVFYEVNLARGGQGWVFAGCVQASPQTANTPTANANDNDGLITQNNIGGITPKTTEAELFKLFGKENVTKEKEIYANGDVPPFKGYMIYKGKPDELQIALDPDKKGTISFIMVRNVGAKWHTAEGIRVGTTLDELNKLNGKPFDFSGLDWDYGGYINDFKGGKLAKLNDVASLRLTHDGNLAQKFMGDQTVKSDDKGLASGKIRVGEISVDMFIKKK